MERNVQLPNINVFLREFAFGSQIFIQRTKYNFQLGTLKTSFCKPPSQTDNQHIKNSLVSHLICYITYKAPKDSLEKTFLKLPFSFQWDGVMRWTLSGGNPNVVIYPTLLQAQIQRGITLTFTRCWRVSQEVISLFVGSVFAGSFRH